MRGAWPTSAPSREVHGRQQLPRSAPLRAGHVLETIATIGQSLEEAGVRERLQQHRASVGFDVTPPRRLIDCEPRARDLYEYLSETLQCLDRRANRCHRFYLLSRLSPAASSSPSLSFA